MGGKSKRLIGERQSQQRLKGEKELNLSTKYNCATIQQGSNLVFTRTQFLLTFKGARARFTKKVIVLYPVGR